MLRHSDSTSDAGVMENSELSRFGFGRATCGELPIAERREWLVTNGIGGYACGTVAGLLARRYHGLLVAALDPPLGRTLLLSKLDETVTYDGCAYPLFANRWDEATVEPLGFRHLERFHLEGTTPVWTFACADALLQKRIWMEPGANTTYVRYEVRRASAPVHLSIKVIVNHRDHHATTHADDWSMSIEGTDSGLEVVAFDGEVPLHVHSNGGECVTRHTWYRGYYLAIEADRGLDCQEDHLYAGRFDVRLEPGDSFAVIATTDSDAGLNVDRAHSRRQAYERGLLDRSGVVNSFKSDLRSAPDWEKHLILAADQFIVRRSLPDEPEGGSIIAGYPWFGDWGRDTMISLPGLTLVTGRHEVAERILRAFARFVDRGMVPNRFASDGARPEYNTADATLWYVEALRAYLAATGDKDLMRYLFPVLQDIVDWHQRGTRFNIGMDPDDGLLYAGESGVQVTWMDAKIDDWVVTPRVGKPVEVNALWYNGLRAIAGIARDLGEAPDRYDDLADNAQRGFARFWNEEVGFCYDVLDGPQGDDPALRPNQLLAVSLPQSPLSNRQQRAVVDVCGRHLLTSHGLRSLAPGEPGFAGHYRGDRRERDAAYHQGTVWAWLIGPFVTAHLRVHGDPAQACLFLRPFVHHMRNHGVGSVSEIFDGTPPFTPRGCVAQAWSVAEMLRALHLVRTASTDGNRYPWNEE